MAEIGDRVQQHRGRLVASGVRRVEVAVPADDAPLLRRVAAVLRAGGQRAEQLKLQLAPTVGAAPARSGEELVAFFRTSPLVGEDIQVERDRSPGRTVDL